MHTIATQSGIRIAYEHYSGSNPGILFCGGFNSSMQGNKARYLKSLCEKNNWQFTCFDYRGHGLSEGEFRHSTLDDWIADCQTIYTRVTSGQQIVVGSSMGVWIALCLAKRNQERIAGLLGIAAAPDFTERLIWPQLSAQQKAELNAGRSCTLESEYPAENDYEISMALIESGQRNQVLNSSVILHCPVRLLHGTEDLSVPAEVSQELLHVLQADDVTLTLKKDADHRFSDTSCLRLIETTLCELRAQIRGE